MKQTSSVRVLVLFAFLVRAAIAALPAAHAEDVAVATTDVDARGLFERGTERYARGQYAEAKQLFEAAYHLSKRPQLLYNMALADDHLRNEGAARASYAAYLEALPQAENADEVCARMRVLEQALQKQSSASAAVAGPEQAARTVFRPSTERAPTERSPGKPLVRRWWVWTAVALALTGVAVSVAVARRELSSEAALPGDNGLVVRALVQP